MDKISRNTALAHDVRNTLTPALIIIESLEKSAQECDRNRFQKLYMAIDRTVLLCDSLMNDESAGNSRNMRKCRIFDIINDAAKTATGTTVKNIVINIAMPENLTFMTNRETLFCALLNLMHNAINAKCRCEGILSVMVSAPDPNSLQITVSDNGMGMRPEIRNSVDTYLSAPNENQCTGRIGIRSTVEALEQINGNLKLISSDAQGTKFKIKLSQAKSLPSHITKMKNHIESQASYDLAI